MTYNNAVKRIQTLPKLSSGSEHIRTVCRALGAPQNQIKAIRICGDAGKTSCAQMLTSILSGSGYKVGYYSTAQLGDLRESIKIGKKEIPHVEFADISKKIFDAAEATGCIGNISQSDVLLIIALVYFSLQECDAGTILSSALIGESLGLSPSPQLGQYYLVPYNDTKNNRKVAQFQLG